MATQIVRLIRFLHGRISVEKEAGGLRLLSEVPYTSARKIWRLSKALRNELRGEVLALWFAPEIFSED